MAYKAFITGFSGYDSTNIIVNYLIFDASNNTSVLTGGSLLTLGSDITSYTLTELQTAAQAKVIYDAGTQSFTVVGGDFVWAGENFLSPTQITNLTQSKFVTDGVSHSFVTTAAAANGFQVSSTRDALVSYTVTVSSAVQIGVVGNVGGYCVLEVASTNSTTAGDWKEKGRVGTGQNIGLAIALSSTQTASATLTSMVPMGFYSRLRTVNSNGTPTYTYVTGTEVLI